MLKGIANGGVPPYPPSPMVGSNAVDPQPSILQEIDRLQRDALELGMQAIGRIVELQVRLTGNRPKPDASDMLREGARFPSDGQLGEAYHRAMELRAALQALHREITELTSI